MENNLSDIKVYQDLTFETLDKLIRERAKEGHSILNVSRFYMGDEFIEYCGRKGLKYKSTVSGYKQLSW